MANSIDDFDPNPERVHDGNRFEDYLDHQVFRCKFTVHVLQPMAQDIARGDDVNRNHMRLYLALGANGYVICDMTGKLRAEQGRLILFGDCPIDDSVTLLHTVDLNAINCPANFDERHSPQGGDHPTVNDFVQSLFRRHMEYFRFLWINGELFGCRHWISKAYKAFIEDGLLVRDQQRQDQLTQALNYHFEESQVPSPLSFTPGLFTWSNGTPPSLDVDDVKRYINAAPSEIVHLVRELLMRRIPELDGSARDGLQLRDAGHPKQAAHHLDELAIDIVEFVEDVDAARDLLSTSPENVQDLADTVRRRKPFAARALDVLLRGDLSNGDRVLVALTVVIDLKEKTRTRLV